MARRIKKSVSPNETMPHSTLLKKQRWGVTLIEVTVGVFVSAILVTVLLRLAQVSYRVGTEEVTRAGAEQQAALIAAKVERDLLTTTPAGTSLSPDGTKLLTDPIETLSNAGRKLFTHRLAFWSFGNATVRGRSGTYLIRSVIATHPTIAGAAPDVPVRFSPPDLESLSTGEGESQTDVHANVTNFKVAPRAGTVAPLVSPDLRLTVEIGLGQAATRKTVKADRLITIRTSGY